MSGSDLLEKWSAHRVEAQTAPQDLSPQPRSFSVLGCGLCFFLITFIKQYVVLKENLAADWKGLNYKVPQAPVGCVAEQAGTLCWCLDNRVQRRENSTRSLINQVPEAKAGPALGPKLQRLGIWMSYSRGPLVAQLSTQTFLGTNEGPLPWVRQRIIYSRYSHSSINLPWVLN